MANQATHPKDTYIVGAQCTGKTTLVDALADHFKRAEHRIYQGCRIAEPAVIKEVARGVLRKHQYTALDITSSPERALQLQKLILEAQYEAEKTTEDRWIISDRSGLDPIVYTRMYVNENESLGLLSMTTSNQLCRRMRDGWVFICEPNRDWLYDDGVRLLPKDLEEWTRFHHSFCELLNQLNIDFAVLSGNVTVEERMKVVLQRWHDS